MSGPPKKAFTGGDQGFISLLLKDVQVVNHNTKKFIFHLPEDDMVSGMAVASALLTKYQYEGQKPVVRPYTPTSDEGKLSFEKLRSFRANAGFYRHSGPH